jgi:hypothetical protein
MGTDKDLLDQITGILRDKTPPRDLPALFEGNPAQVHAALAVYRNNVRSSLMRVLSDTFPVLFELVGEAFFKFLAHEYFQAHPPTSRMDNLPAFLAGFAPAAAYPYLPDVARLEILYLDAYHAADAELMTPEQTIAVAGDDIESLVLKLHPSVRFLASDYPAVSIWQAHKSEPRLAMREIKQIGEHALIARSHNHVTIRVLTHGAFIALKALSVKQALGKAMQMASQADKSFNPQDFFQILFQLQIIAGVQQAGI